MSAQPQAMPGVAVRVQAALTLETVLAQHRSLKGALAKALPALADSRDRALLEAICFAVLRHRRRYEYVLEQWLQKPLPRREYRVHCLLLTGLAQLDELKLPAHAAVSATVAATRALGFDPQAGLVNAVLRRVGREALPASDAPEISSSHPDWLVQRLRAERPEDLDRILEANNRPAPMWLRVNTRNSSRTELLAAFRAAGFAAEAPNLPAKAIRLAEPAPVDALPGWSAGKFTVQDGAAQLAVEALAPKPGERVLDACAAPGGKTAQIAETLTSGHLLALDVAATRVTQIHATLARLGLASPDVEVKLADAADPMAWWDGQPLDAILLDAPCSATGIIRRQPDIKWNRRESDIATLAALQARLLDLLWITLGPGGRLLYATCSVLKAENEQQIENFLARMPDAEALPLDERYGHASGRGRQRLPGEDGMDGFFYALLRKRG